MKMFALTLAAMMVIASTGCGTDGTPQTLTYVAHGTDNVPHLFKLNPTTKTTTAVAITIPSGVWYVTPNRSASAVAYERNDQNGDHVYYMGTDSVEKQLTTDSTAFAPVFSPDGKTIAYNDLPTNSNYEVFTMNVDGTNQKALYAPPVGTVDQFYPQFSPDGKSVVFYIALACGPNVSRNAGKANSHMRSGYHKNTSSACDGPQSGTPSQNGWYTMALTDTTPTLVYTTNNWWGPPAYSLDGKKLFVTDYDGTQWNIFSVNIDGTGVTAVTTNTDVESFSAVPFQNGVLFNRDGNSTWDIYTMDATGTNQLLLNSTPSTYESLDDAYWSD